MKDCTFGNQECSQITTNEFGSVNDGFDLMILRYRTNNSGSGQIMIGVSGSVKGGVEVNVYQRKVT